MTDAKPDVGALVARAIAYHAEQHATCSSICGIYWDVGLAAEAQEHKEFHDALLAQQAEIARLTQENEALAAAMPSEGADAAIGYASMKADRDRLREENARLAGEVARLEGNRAGQAIDKEPR